MASAHYIGLQGNLNTMWLEAINSFGAFWVAKTDVQAWTLIEVYSGLCQSELFWTLLGWKIDTMLDHKAVSKITDCCIVAIWTVFVFVFCHRYLNQILTHQNQQNRSFAGYVIHSMFQDKDIILYDFYTPSF